MTNTSFVIGMTYNEDDERNRDGARAFRYSDIRLFMARLRRQIRYHYKVAGAVRFLVCGENGAEKGRVHWHMCLFANVPILPLGDWSYWGRPIVEDADKFTPRVNWSLWPHGHVTLQQPDEGGFAYATKYSTKDQWSAAKSEGVQRLEKAESYASGYFRMSKRPPIGENWLFGHLNAILEQGALPVTINVRPPGYSGYWFLTGRTRRAVLFWLRDARAAIVERTGREAPQWPALRAELSSEDLEVVEYEAETEIARLGAELQEGLERSRIQDRERVQRAARREIVRRCGRARPCAQCLGWLDEWERAGVETYVEVEAHRLGVESAEEINRIRLGSWEERRVNPFCEQRSDRRVIDAFKHFAGSAI